MQTTIKNKNDSKMPIDVSKLDFHNNYAGVDFCMTSHLAKHYETKLFENQRYFIEKWGETLTWKMKENKFVQGANVCIGILEGKEYLVDGQHTLSSIIRSGLAQWVSMKFYRVNTKEELEMLYANIQPGKARNQTDIVRSLGLNELFDLNLSNSGRVMGALGWIFTSFQKSEMIGYQPNEKLEIAKEYCPEVKLYHNLIEELDGMKNTDRRSNYWHIQILPVALLSLRMDQDFAIDFWGSVVCSAPEPQTPGSQVIGRITRNDSKRIETIKGLRVTINCYKAAKEGKNFMKDKIYNKINPLLDPLVQSENFKAGWDELMAVIKMRPTKK